MVRSSIRENHHQLLSQFYCTQFSVILHEFIIPKYHSGQQRVILIYIHGLVLHGSPSSSVLTVLDSVKGPAAIVTAVTLIWYV